MKRFHWLIVLLASFAFASCLDENPKDQIDEGQLYTSASDIYVHAVSSLYNYIGGANESEGLQGTCRGVYDYNTLTTDEAIIPIRGGDWYDGGFWNALYQHRWTPDDESLYDTWCYLYKVILLANHSLDVIGEHQLLLTPDQSQAYQAEVRAVRALFYYEAFDLFGRVPLVLTAGEIPQAEAPLAAGPDVLRPKQSERSQVYRFVVGELQSVLPLLPDAPSQREGNHYGRITRPVAHFLLAKLALNAEVYLYDHWTQGYDHRPDGKQVFFEVDGQRLNAWDTCLHYCRLLADEGYTMEDDYAFNFSTHNETSRENIFTIPMDKNLYANQCHYLFRSYHYAHGGALGWGSENGTCATISTMKANHYGEADEDARCRTNFVAGAVRVDGKPITTDGTTPLVYQPFEVRQNLTNSPYVKTAGARMGKYEVDRTAYMDGKLPSNDLVLFRYADALLMEAEALVRNGADGSEPLNAVRSRVGMPARAATLPDILDERLLELVWEGWRRQDLVRFGRFTTAYDLRQPLEGESSGYTTVFPIPRKCIELNPNLTQNPGY